MPGRRTILAAGAAVLLAAPLAACGADAVPGPLPREQAMECRELGGGIVHIRYETEDGLEVRNQHGLDHQRAQVADGISEQAHRVLETRGWSEEALSELSGPQQLSPEVAALLASMPSCLEELRERP